MKQILEQIIADLEQRELPPFTPRSLSMPALRNKVNVIIGMRRTGKTTFLYQRMDELLSSGVPKEAMLYINFDDERLLPMQLSHLRAVTEIYFQRHPEMKDRRVYLFFDEVENIDGWEHFVRRLVDKENVQIAVTGSSAKLLSHEIATSMRGRSLRTEVFPFSFAEALRHAEIEAQPSKKPGGKTRALLKNRIRHYLLTGGFPEVQTLDERSRLRVLQEYVDVVILRDIVERHNISNIAPLRAMVRRLLGGSAGLFTVNKFFNELKSRGMVCGKNTLHDYLAYLIDTYLVFTVPIHTGSESTKRVNPQKVYPIDTALAAAFMPVPRPDPDRQLESLVFLHLRRSESDITYYRTQEGFEVDFHVLDHRGESALFQVCAEIGPAKTREREIRALSSAMNECDLSTGTIITMDQEEVFERDGRRIEVVPAWRFFLDTNLFFPRP
jgi:hypothetical protein